MVKAHAIRGAAACGSAVNAAPRWFGLLQPPVVTLVIALLVWETAVRLFDVPIWLVPAPSHVAATLVTRFGIILPEAIVTASNTVAGFIVGAGLGAVLALAMASSPLLARALAPLLVVSQALPLIALAPLLVIWFGFGMASKVAMAALVIFFAVTAAFYDGLSRTDDNLLDLATLYGANRAQRLWLVRVPAAMPSLASGLKIAAAYAPIGAITGEWVGASQGLGLMLIQANARMQTDMVFAGLAVLVAFSLLLWWLVGRIARHLMRFAPDTSAR
jgi:putative hydroxymethylpyrimidine transport system permease protein